MEDSKQLIINQWHLGYVNLSLRYFVFLQYTMLKPPWICLHETAAKFVLTWLWEEWWSCQPLTNIF